MLTVTALLMALERISRAWGFRTVALTGPYGRGPQPVRPRPLPGHRVRRGPGAPEFPRRDPGDRDRGLPAAVDGAEVPAVALPRTLRGLLCRAARGAGG